MLSLMIRRTFDACRQDRMIFLAMAFLVLILIGGLWFVQRMPSGPAVSKSPDFTQLAARLRDLERRFPGDDPDRPLAFPADHGPHPKAAAETWDFAGWLRDGSGRDFGFRLSFARLGLRPDPPRRPSAWAASAVYRGLFALADGSGGGFHSQERFERAALGLCGFDAAAGRLWLDHWAMRVSPDETAGFTLRAETGGNAVDLRLGSLKPAVMPEGLSGGGNLRAYLLSRLDVTGMVTTEGRIRAVTGSAWLSHAWGRLLPTGGQVALDRLQLQLDDGRELLILRLRRRDGSAEPVDRGLWIGAEGRTETLSSRDVQLKATGWWLSPKSRARYPVRWSLRLPSLKAELSLMPLVENQEVEGASRGWSGAVWGTGTVAGRPVSGVGFVELSGY
jgi:predicted secreted hydrolase